MHVLCAVDEAVAATESDQHAAISVSDEANVEVNEENVDLVAQFLEAAGDADLATLERLMEVDDNLVDAVDGDGFSALVRANK